jgi:hypothetical protein
MLALVLLPHFSSTSAPPAGCVAPMDAWCNSAAAGCTLVSPTGPPVALHDRSHGSAAQAWRCYDPGALDAATHSRYVSGSNYCTRDSDLAAVEQQCDRPAPTPAPPPAGVMQLHVLSNSSAAAATAPLCLDGTPGAFYLARGADANKWVIWHEGKGWCLSDADCAARALSTDGRGGWAASGWPATPGCLPPTLLFAAGLPCPAQATCQLSPDAALNPAFHSFNMVFVKTCDGGSFTGSRDDPITVVQQQRHPPVTAGPQQQPQQQQQQQKQQQQQQQLHYRGRAILDAVIDALLALGIGNATEVVVGGGSAGALATYLHADHYAARLNQTNPGEGSSRRVVALPDCGFFMDTNGEPPAAPGAGYHDGIAWMHSAAGMNASASLDPRCRAAHAGKPELCLFAAHLAPFIRTPVFALQAQFDAYQIPHILRNEDAAVVNAFGANLTAALAAGLLEGRPGNAAMVDSCEHHCDGYDTYRVDAITQAEAVHAWYANGSAALPNAGRIFATDAFPCSACCH